MSNNELKISEIDLPVQELLLETSPRVEEAADTDGYKPYKVFINHVDAFHSKYIASFVADQIYGLSKFGAGVGGEEAEAEEAADKAEAPNKPTQKYELIGTLACSYNQPSEDFLYAVDESSAQFREEILKCGFVIYDITTYPSEIDKAMTALGLLTEELDKVADIGPKTYDSFSETKIFILISPVMTWALTKPLDPNDPDLPFSEVDYKKRRPHPNYKQHYECEKSVIKVGQKYKNKLKTYVVCTALTYGEEEDLLEFFFKMAWYNEVLPIFDVGDNRIPFIHVRDLAKALHGLMETAPVKPQYILAVEQTPTTLKQFVRSLSKALSDGNTRNIVAEEAFLYKNLTQTLFERCTVNLNMEPVFLVENLQLEYQSDSSIAENIHQIVDEFKAKRKLKPVKIVVHGPPGAGKTLLAKKLCDFYNCKYVSVGTMLDDFINIWRESLNKPVKPEEMLAEEDVVGEMEEEAEDPQQILEQIREVQVFMEGGVENIPDDFLCGLLKNYLARNFCQNRGYVLDGYPFNIPQAKQLFGQEAEAAGEGGEEEEVVLDNNSKIVPDLVVSLVASDEYIAQYIMKLPEDVIKDTPHEEYTILDRLSKYRDEDTEENTVLNYFDELEVDIMLLDVKDDEHEENFRYVCQKLGAPPTFGMSFDELEELRRIEEEERRLASEKEELERQLQLERAEQERKDKMEAWSITLEKLQKEEEKILVAQSEPLRHYLMKYIFPTLTRGLIELATLKPDDPVDFLAEFLFRQNPEGRVFDQSYTAEGEDLYGEFRRFIEKIVEDNENFPE